MHTMEGGKILCHKMFSTMKYKNSRNCQRRRRQLINFLMLSITWTLLFTETMARPNLQELLPPHRTANDVAEEEEQHQQQQQQEDLFLDEIITSTNNEKLFNKLQKYHHNQPHYLNKWPGLRDLVSTFDYDDDNNGLEESNSDFFNSKLFERLRQLASLKSYYDDEEASALSSSNQLSIKDHNVKKNVQFHKQYMSPCHFKICNMGRKRDARFLKTF